MSLLSRRHALRSFGLGLLAPVAPSLFSREARAAGTRGAPWRLVAPLRADSWIGGARLLSLSEVTPTGTVDIDFERPDGARFRARMCRRDDRFGAPEAVARTRHYEFFLVNNGRGQKPTSPGEGLPVLALAEVVQRNERRHGPVAVGTLRERWRLLARRTA
jgi:hypothetical protein